MKKLIGGLVLVAALGPAALAQETGVKIKGTSHDFSTLSGGYVGTGGTYQNKYGQCSTCHSAHKAKQFKQLWGRAVSAGASWIVYDDKGAENVIYDANGNAVNVEKAGMTLGAAANDDFLSASEFEMSGSGRCLSCHDGRTAIGTVNGVAVTMNAGTKNFGTDLHGKHPVGMKIPQNDPDNFYADVNPNYPDAPADPEALVKQDILKTVGCVSCHSMHRGENSVTTGTDGRLHTKILRKGDRCLACHNR